ncbi:RING-H2 finger protein ATL64-like [Eucalyptus grandis]|uniref:RING-H2 finger protein ATL64-like n=1 Tax=Eucalyptus grandis TaxID=71139 RepID=UPI00192F09B9|nr:RING-H2 finger protein ATL64-like [Eucalyptus grandis]
MPPQAAPSPLPLPLPSPPPDLTGQYLFAMLYAACVTFALLVLVGCVYYYHWRHNRMSRARHDHDIERLQRWVEAVAPQVVVVEYHGDARKFDIDECPICLEVFEEGEQCGMFKTCGHGYHQSCIKEWLSKHSRCPLCRGLVQVRQAARVTLVATGS